jgi:hypothetical protein
MDGKPKPFRMFPVCFVKLQDCKGDIFKDKHIDGSMMISMGISGSYNGATVPYKAIFCGD